MKKTALIGVGNLLFHDEGVGIYAVQYLSKNYTFNPSIEIIDGGTLGVRLSEYFMDYDHVVLLDSIGIDDAPGSVYRIPGHELGGLGSTASSVHEIEVTQMLDTCFMAGGCAEVEVVGIVPEDISQMKIGLSGTLKGAFGVMLETALQALKDAGAEARLKSEPVSLENIIAECGGRG